jgi:hypothetical protein
VVAVAHDPIAEWGRAGWPPARAGHRPHTSAGALGDLAPFFFGERAPDLAFQGGHPVPVDIHDLHATFGELAFHDKTVEQVSRPPIRIGAARHSSKKRRSEQNASLACQASVDDRGHSRA